MDCSSELKHHLVEDDVGSNKDTEALQQITDDMDERGFHVDVVRFRGGRRHGHHVIDIVHHAEAGIIHRPQTPGPGWTCRHSGMTVSVAASL